MRTLLLAGAGIITAIGGGAQAQRAPGASYPPPTATMPAPLPAANRPTAIHRPAPLPASARPSATRWGSTVDGRWWGGANAPGGWNAYRRPVRGVALPPYWVSPRFAVNDWNSYGLGAPGQGRRWARYYDDAVLIDDRGTVYDTVGDVDWIGARRDDYVRDDRRYAERAPVRRDDGWRGDRRGGGGLTGAAIGAVAGGVAGNVIAGRGNRLGGTLIGAGVGAAGGYAIDRSRGRGRRAEPGYDYPVAPDYPPDYADDYGPDYGPDYDPYHDDGYPPPPPPPPVAPAVTTIQGGAPWISPDGSTTVTTTTAGGYPAGRYYYPGATTTTVVVQSAPVITTTTTEVFEDRVRYTPRRIVRRKTKLLRR